MAVELWKTFPVKRNLQGTLEVDIWNGDSFLDCKRRMKRPYQLVRHTEAWIGRWDLLAYEVYNDVQLWWAVLVANDVLDPFVEPGVGAVLRVPSVNDVLEWLRWR